MGYDYFGVVSTLFDINYTITFDYETTTNQNRQSLIRYVAKISISVASGYLQFIVYGAYLFQASSWSFIRYIIKLNFSGDGGEVATNGNVSYKVVNGSVQILATTLKSLPLSMHLLLEQITLLRLLMFMTT